MNKKIKLSIFIMCLVFTSVAFDISAAGFGEAIDIEGIKLQSNKKVAAGQLSYNELSRMRSKYNIVLTPKDLKMRTFRKTIKSQYGEGELVIHFFHEHIVVILPGVKLVNDKPNLIPDKDKRFVATSLIYESKTRCRVGYHIGKDYQKPIPVDAKGSDGLTGPISPWELQGPTFTMKRKYSNINITGNLAFWVTDGKGKYLKVKVYILDKSTGNKYYYFWKIRFLTNEKRDSIFLDAHYDFKVDPHACALFDKSEVKLKTTFEDISEKTEKNAYYDINSSYIFTLSPIKGCSDYLSQNDKRYIVLNGDRESIKNLVIGDNYNLEVFNVLTKISSSKYLLVSENSKKLAEIRIPRKESHKKTAKINIFDISKNKYRIIFKGDFNLNNPIH